MKVRGDDMAAFCRSERKATKPLLAINGKAAPAHVMRN